MTLLAKNIRPRDIINQKSLENAFVVDMALGGSTNTFCTCRQLPAKPGLASR